MISFLSRRLVDITATALIVIVPSFSEAAENYLATIVGSVAG